MTVKELKDLLADVPDDYQVVYEYDGPDARVYIEANIVYLEKYANRIIISEENPV